MFITNDICEYDQYHQRNHYVCNKHMTDIYIYITNYFVKDAITQIATYQTTCQYIFGQTIHIGPSANGLSDPICILYIRILATSNGKFAGRDTTFYRISRLQRHNNKQHMRI